ncbi:DUF4432 family protein [Microbacterium sp. ZW T5_45]|uniref:DUF4432 family protein n=1 Tax=Microbacterium sp. ZW T5_45 TaxID=3378080 RepID=UPI00385315D6
MLSAVWPQEGEVPHEDLLASAEEFSSRQGRVVRVRTFGGWDVELLPDRGLDIGLALHGGVPVSWVSPVRDRRPLDRPRDRDWIARFHGGLMATCGLRGFGPPQEDRGLHGQAGHLPAGAVAVSRRVTAEAAEVAVSAVIEDARIFAPSLRLERTVTLRSWRGGRSALEVHDVLSNHGPGEAEIGMLYHVNLGAPLVASGSRITVRSDDLMHRGGVMTVDPAVYPAVAEGVDEHVVERTGFDGDQAVVTVTGTAGELALEWSAGTLPHLAQWVYPARNRWALGLEPATSSLVDEGAQLVRLPEGSSRRHELRLSLENRVAM